MIEFLRSIPWYAWVAIVAILAGAFQAVVKSIHRHEQRMAMIKQGMDPSKLDDDS
jgi:hypothetical protein